MRGMCPADWVLVLTLWLTCCATLGKLLNLSVFYVHQSLGMFVTVFPSEYVVGLDT